MNITTLVSTILSILAPVVSRVAPCTIFKLVVASFIFIIGIRMMFIGVISAGQPSFTSISSCLFQSSFEGEAHLDQLADNLYSGFGKYPLLISLSREGQKLRGRRSRGSFKQFGILALHNRNPLKWFGISFSNLPILSSSLASLASAVDRTLSHSA